MTAPNVRFTRQDGQTGSRAASNIGTLVIVATSERGPADRPAAFSDPNSVLTQYGQGPLAEYASYVIGVARRPVIVVRAEPSEEGAYGDFVKAGAPSTSPASISAGSTEPLDAYDVAVRFPKGGAVGVAGATVQTSIDAGKTWSKVRQLGTANSISIPDTGVSVALGTGNLADGQSVRFSTRGPQLSLSDMSEALEALRVTSLDYEAVLLDAPADADFVSGATTWLNSLEAKGRYKRLFLNARFREDGESPAEYQEAMAAVRAAASDVRVNVGADGGLITSAIKKVPQLRPLSLFAAARVMNNALGQDASAVADGPLSGVSIVDAAGMPVRHDESANPGLDDLKFMTLRTFERRSGAFLTNPNVFSPEGSDYVFDQHTRCMNRAIEVGEDALTIELSRAVRKDAARMGPNGEVYVAESELRSIEQAVQLAVQAELSAAVTAVQFTLSRADDVGANSGARLTGWLEIESLAYVKQFDVTARFSRQITSRAA